MGHSVRSTSFLKSVDLRKYRSHQFSCEARAIGLPPGYFPKTIETDAGNGEPLSVERAAFGADDRVLGILYRQGDLGLKVLVQIG